MIRSYGRPGPPAAATGLRMAATHGQSRERRGACRQSAFTLVELLVSILVFAVLAATAYTALGGLSAAAGQHQQRSERFADIQRTVSRLDADLRQLVSRPIRAEDGTLQPALWGQPGRISATRAGWINPADQPRSQLQRFDWTAHDAGLVRTSWAVTDRVPATPTRGEPQITGVRGFELRYLDRVGQWHETWPPGGQPIHTLPRAVEYRIELIDRGSIRRLVTLDP